MTEDIHPLHQHENYARAVNRLGGDIAWVECSGRRILCIRKRIFGITIGWTGGARSAADCSDAAINIISMAIQAQRPRFAIRLARGRVNGRLDLSPDIGRLRKQLAPKWRNRLVRAEKSGLSIRQSELSADPTHWLLMADQKQALGKKYRNWPPALTAAYASSANSTLLIETEDGSAAMLFLIHGKGASYHIGWRSLNAAGGAHNLLMWFAMLFLKSRGIEVLDLGVLPETAAGLCRFKLGTGAEKVQQGNTYLCLGYRNRKSRPSGGFFGKLFGVTRLQ